MKVEVLGKMHFIDKANNISAELEFNDVIYLLNNKYYRLDGNQLIISKAILDKMGSEFPKFMALIWDILNLIANDTGIMSMCYPIN